MYAYCEERGLPIKRCGKLIVATSSAEVAVHASFASSV
jgi:L-2-hydroxyglutarate oxidase LhgO